MNRKRSQLQSYFAGIADGEGYFGIRCNTSSKTFTGRFTLQMDDPHAVMMIAREYPQGNVSYHHRPIGMYGSKYKSQFWRIEFVHYKAYDFVRDIEPFLLVKREQAKVLLSFLAHRRKDHAKRACVGNGKANCDYCFRAEKLVKDLKRKNKGVKTVELGELRQYRAKPEEAEADQQFADELMSTLWERVETSGEDRASNKPISAPEQDIVQ